MPLQLLEGMSSRKRRPNWTDQECLLLAQLMQEKKEIIRGKCSTGVSIQDKRQAWEEITQAINTSFPQIQRTVSDCNKKWENLLSKSREEIKRQKRQSDGGVSLDELSAVTQLVISVMNLSDMLHQDGEDCSFSDLVETQQNRFRCEKDANSHTDDDSFTNKCPLAEHEFSTYPQPPASPVEQKMSAFTNLPRSHVVQFGSAHAAFLMASGDHPDTPCSTSPTTAHCASLQERMDLEMSVLRRQEAVLKLQEEYYTLKIKLMRKQMGEPPQTD